jgi:hypothetical protein
MSKTARERKPQPMHVLPNQSKHPAVGSHVMIGITSPKDVGGNDWKSASVIQVAPPRHDDQQYRFKWQLVDNTAGMNVSARSKKMLAGWTNEHQRVNSRDSKCDDRIATHASFDFVRHCDILEINKFDLERQLYKELLAAPSNLIDAFDSTHCAICNLKLEKGIEKEIHVVDKQMGKHRSMVLPCCRRNIHSQCINAFESKVTATELTELTDTTSASSASSSPKRLLPCFFCSQDIQAKAEVGIVAQDLKKAKEGYLEAQVAMAMRYAQGTEGVEKHDVLARMLLEKTSEQGDLQSTHFLAFFYADGRAGLDALTNEQRIEAIKHLWKKCAAKGLQQSQDALNRYFPSKELQEERKQQEYSRQLAETIAKMEQKNKELTKEERRAEIVRKLAEAAQNTKDRKESTTTVEATVVNTIVPLFTAPTSYVTVKSSDGLFDMLRSECGKQDDVTVNTMMMAKNKFKRGAPGGSPPGQCPKAHGLAEFKATHQGFTCDICKLRQRQRAQMYGCDICDYDVCRKCSKEYFKKEGKYRAKASKVQVNTTATTVTGGASAEKSTKLTKAEKKAAKAEKKAARIKREADEMKAAKAAKAERRAARKMHAAAELVEGGGPQPQLPVVLPGASTIGVQMEGETAATVAHRVCTSCGKEESASHGVVLKDCTCKLALYCANGGKCQKKDWKTHKKIHRQNAGK